jgi:broad specificity phosphatase PhoE
LTRRLVVVRHGRTAWNAAGRYQGHADPPLDSVGVEQATRLAPQLAALDPQLIVTSDLRRAVATAVPLARATGLVPEVDARLREVHLGAWEGLTRPEAAIRFPDEMAAWEAGVDVARGGGETRAHAGRRCGEAIMDRLAATEPGSVVVVVSHGLVLRCALRHLRAAGLVSLDEDPPHFDNCQWMQLATVDADEVPTGAGPSRRC